MTPPLTTSDATAPDGSAVDDSALSFPKVVHIRSRLDFSRVYDQGQKRSDGLLMVAARRTGEPITRLGLAVSKRSGNAVRRNRWKRLLREAFRQTRRQLPSGLDVVVQPRAAQPPPLDAMRRSLITLIERLARKLPVLESANSQSTVTTTASETSESP